ncbi:MAG: hypothetical protein SFV15_16535 [Polyangiaceae bacterium]|nr:hypothetical protein [Polyangiaceae bacterium]
MNLKKPVKFRPSLQANVAEFAARLASDIQQAAQRVDEQASRLQIIGEQAVVMTCTIFRDSGPRDLRQHSNAIRGIVGHALAILADLQCEAGRLEALADLKDVVSDARTQQ